MEEESFNELEEGTIEITQFEQRENRLKKLNRAQEPQDYNQKNLTFILLKSQKERRKKAGLQK